MQLTTVLFDLDGTLFPMEEEGFTKAYFGLMAKKMAKFGYDPEQLVKTIWAGTKAMIKNDGTKTNEEVFWDLFVSVYGKEKLKDYPEFDAFYHNEFQQVQNICGFNKHAKEIVETVKAKGYRVALATNPLFPSYATESRIRWAGLDKQDFEIVTTYENSHYSKPNPGFYKEVFAKLNVQPEECLMIGNDVTEDMMAKDLGCSVYLLTDMLINKQNKDINDYPHGSSEELLEFIKNL